MNAVGRIGSYISRSVYTVSGPFHPFGGAVDIVVVEQPDGTFKSSPWYVRFGKFQGVLKAKEKVVSISVNGVEADFHMYLDHKGEAYFLREVEAEKGDALLSLSSSGDDTDGQSQNRRQLKSKSCNYDVYKSDSITQIDISNENVVTRTNSGRSRIFGFVFGRKSTNGGRLPEKGNVTGVVRTESLERAEIAADLLEVKWSTNLPPSKHKKNSVSKLSSEELSDGISSSYSLIRDGQGNDGSLVLDKVVDTTDDHNPTDSIHCVSNVNDFIVDNMAINANRPNIISEVAIAESQIQDSVKLEVSPLGGCPRSQDFDDTCPNSYFSEDENRTNSLPHLLHSETYPSPTGQLDEFEKEPIQSPCFSNGAPEQIFVGTFPKTYLVCETNSQPKACLNIEGRPCIQVIYEKRGAVTVSDDRNNPESTEISTDSTKKGFFTETVSFQPVHGPVQDIESRSNFTISAFGDSTCQPLVEKDNRNEIVTVKLDHPMESVNGLEVSLSDPVQHNVLQSECSEDGHLFFGDLDDFKGNVTRHLEEPLSLDDEKKVDLRLSEVNEFFIANHESCSSGDCSGMDDRCHDSKDLTRKLKNVSNACNVPAASGLQSKEVTRIAKSLPNMWTHNSGLHDLDLGQSSDCSLNSDSNMLNPMLLRKDIPSDIGRQSHETPHPSDGATNVEELKNGRANIVFGDSSRSLDSPNASWSVWSVPFKRSRSMKAPQSLSDFNASSDVESFMNRKDAAEDGKALPKMKPSKKKIRSTSPTSEQLASLNLKAGRNTVEFTFSTAMLGKQKVDALIYLWKWDARIVISDVDGTITRSDLLGQVMPLVGMDWSQTGVTHLFSSIKENGYQLLFLSARSISQAYNTRQFLFNLKKDGKALPEGPVVISPDGLFPSLYREVVRRAPHEFKIACLEDIKSLFPLDRNPFYAGFGNRDTDEISYHKVGIPKGKIFIINPRGEIVVNRRVDTKSYNSLHGLVHDMFPPMSSSEQEDYNSWNYWKLPPPAIDM